MAGATEMDGRDGEKFLVVLRFTLTPISPPPYVLYYKLYVCDGIAV